MLLLGTLSAGHMAKRNTAVLSSPSVFHFYLFEALCRWRTCIILIIANGNVDVSYDILHYYERNFDKLPPKYNVKDLQLQTKHFSCQVLTIVRVTKKIIVHNEHHAAAAPPSRIAISACDVIVCIAHYFNFLILAVHFVVLGNSLSG